ncbi:MAG: peptidoglycan bridge formation glycyltransferase FemA/FemB family protein [Candidatus Woykebacteria bacterium]
MSLSCKEIDKEDLEYFLGDFPHTPFLQSFAWGQFQKQIENKVYRFGVFDSEKLVGVVSAQKVKAKFASFLYVPWGPLIKDWEKQKVEPLLNKLAKIAKEDNLDFVRLEPRVIGGSEAEILERGGFRQSRFFTQPECTSIMNLSKSEEELLSAMSDSTRYNVGMVERKGVKVRIGNSEDIGIFEKLLKETASRHQFTVDIKPGYYRKQYEILSEKGIMKVLVAEYNGQPLAAALVVFYGDTATYLHAASSRTQPKLRAPYLLVWKVMLEGKKRGFKYFDFWGVAPENAGENHPWSGVTSFKMSFGGERICYSPVFDLPTSNKYLFAKFIENIRKPVRKILRLS